MLLHEFSRCNFYLQGPKSESCCCACMRHHLMWWRWGGIEPFQRLSLLLIWFDDASAATRS